jgi:pyruvate formate lyase activating enzyme
MKIAKVIQEGTIDYRGKYGPTLFLGGCNFNCGFCQNHELIDETKGDFNFEEFIKKLIPKVNSGWYNGICISGGEPTLQEDLPEIAKRLKKIGLAVKIDTNGSNPDMLETLVWSGDIDYVAMDIKSPREDYHKITRVQTKLEDLDRSIALVKQFRDYEFRTTVLPFLSETDFRNIGKWMSKNNKPKRYVLQQFLPENAFISEYKEMIPKTKAEILAIGRIMEDYAQEVKIDA